MAPLTEWLLDQSNIADCVPLLNGVANEFGETGWLSGDTISENSELFLFTYLRLLLLQKRNQEVVGAAANAATEAHNAGRSYSVVKFLVFQAAVWNHTNKTRARTTLNRALALAEGEPIVRSFLPVTGVAPCLFESLPNSYRQKSLFANLLLHGASRNAAATNRPARSNRRLY